MEIQQQTHCVVLVPLNGLLMVSVGASDWTLCSASVPLIQDHIHDVRVPPVPLLNLLRLLLLQRADVHPASSAHLLGRAHLAHGHQIPSRQRTKPPLSILSGRSHPKRAAPVHG